MIFFIFKTCNRVWLLVQYFSYLARISPSEAHVHVWLSQHCAGYIDVVASSHRVWRGFKAHKRWPTGNCHQEKDKFHLLKVLKSFKKNINIYKYLMVFKQLNHTWIRIFLHLPVDRATAAWLYLNRTIVPLHKSASLLQNPDCFHFSWQASTLTKHSSED